MCSQTSSQKEGLEIEKERLQKAVYHLKRSNRELEDALVSEGPDREFRQAIGENIVIIARYQGEIERLDQEIRKAHGEVVNVTSSQRIPIPVEEPVGESTAEKTVEEQDSGGSIWM